jgi:3-mercaptopropionate dioxygenase
MFVISEQYRQHVRHVEPDGSFSVVTLVWLPGQPTPIHDHVTWCVVGVYKGNEHEVRFRLENENDVDYLVEVEQATNHEGSVAALTPPGIFTLLGIMETT